jgi:hypothetical protein
VARSQLSQPTYQPSAQPLHLCIFSLSLIHRTHYPLPARASVIQRLAVRSRAVTRPRPEPFPRKFHQVYTNLSQADICLQSHHPSRPHAGLMLHTYSPNMSCLTPSTSSTERISQGTIHSESQLQRYASSTCHAYQVVSKHGSRATVHWHALRRCISWMMIRFLISFISIDLPSLTEVRMTITFSQEGRDGTVKSGGTSSGAFAKEGGISYWGLHPTSVFALSV